jgi:diguanylate cyclase (GGDEF)-like protein
MPEILACLVDAHDHRTVALACVILLVAASTALVTARRALKEDRNSQWVLLTAGLLGGGAWSTHFVAVLAYDSGLPTGYDPLLTVGSVIVAIGGTAAGVATWVRAAGPDRAALGGAVVGASIVLMHYLGMAALRVPGHFLWSPAIVAASALIGIGGMGAAFALLHRGAPLAACALLVSLAVAGLHFTGMGALHVIPDPAIAVSPTTLPRMQLAGLVAAVTLTWLGAGITAALLRARLHRRRQATEQTRLRSLAEASFEAVLLCDHSGRIIDANARLGELLGDPSRTVRGCLLDELLVRDVCDDAVNHARAAAGACRAETGTLDGRLPVEVRARSIETVAGSRLVVALRDLSERIAADGRIRHLAHHDPLTDLPNRLLLQDRLWEAKQQADGAESGFALLCLDIDRFRTINDLYGHTAGDRLLRQAGQRLSGCVRSSDTVARVGGDEFVVLVSPMLSPSDTANLAERIVQVLSQPYELAGGVIASASASVGIALYPSDATEAEALMRAADMALHRAKQAGRNGYAFFEPGMEEDLLAQRQLEQQLRLAVANDQFFLLYQPIASAIDGEVQGFEALMRWRHPQRGLVPPAEFIPLAENCNAIVQLGEWALREACREAASWQRKLWVAVNVSPLQIQRADFAPMLRRILAETGLPASRLQIEVTETLFVADVERALKVLKEVKAIGIRVALDDFGTGYSSLATLRTFPFDKIKVDRSFVQGLGEDEQSRAIVRAVLGLGRGMRLPVVAEGVETTAQLQELRRERCTEVQGYLIGRPQPIEHFGELVGTMPQLAAAK